MVELGSIPVSELLGHVTYVNITIDKHVLNTSLVFKNNKNKNKIVYRDANTQCIFKPT